MDDSTTEKSLTHTTYKDILSKDEIIERVAEIEKKITEKFKDSEIELKELNKYLSDLCDFDLGRFLIYNKGALSGYWTYYVIMGYNSCVINNMTEKFILENSPSILATRERFGIFQKLLSTSIKENSVVCSIPCGVMADFITLEIDEQIKNIQFVGIDLDNTVFDTAQKLAQQHNKSKYGFSFFKEDAWNMQRKNEFDAITSNGLNIYEKDDNRVVALYKNFFNALKPGGVFIGSSLSTAQEWDQEKIEQDSFRTQKKIFATILEATWQNYRTAEKSESQLKLAGFEDIQFHWDSRKIFYSFSAKKINNKTIIDAPQQNNTIKL